MSAEYLVCPASSEHLEAVAELYESLTAYLETHINYPGWKHGVYPTRETAEEGLKSGSLFVCLYNSTVAGTCILDGDQPARYADADWWAGNRPEEILVIHTLAIHPDFFRRGVSETLLCFADRYAEQNGKTSIRLDVLPSNQPGISLYRKCGYRLAGKIYLQRGPWDQTPFDCFEKIVKIKEKNYADQ